MSIRDLFLDNDNYKLLSKDPTDLRRDGESLGNISDTFKNREKFIPRVDFSEPENFAHYGSAEEYYENAITRIYGNYPYDGSSKEKQIFLNKSTYVDLWVLNNKYPRTNGYINHGLMGGYTGTTGTTVAWALTNDNEYIHMVGGPHTASQGMIGKPLQETFDDSNVYDENIYDDVGYIGKGTRESNLKCDPDNGVTVEFWLKKPTWAPAFLATDPVGESIFDLSGTNDGRFNVSITSGSGPVVRFNCLYRAQTLSNSYTPDVTTLISTGSWNHVAVSYANSGSVAEWKLYLNGNLVDTEAAASQPVEITGSLQANIGALVAAYPGEAGTALADGKLTGSLDEFRYWKTQRTSEDIGRYWFTQVYGGTNTDIANATLGVYYKFNEGITGDSSIDSSVLDYSGRISNGAWTGYTTNSRTTASAMVEAGATAEEFLDPIIYSENPLVQSVLAEMKSSGSFHDVQNGTSLYNSFPTWVVDGDDDGDGDLKKLTQIMSSYLDTLYLQIQELPTFKNIEYFSGSYAKELPFIAEILEGAGFVAPEIFANASVLSQIFQRSETEKYEENLTEIKNLIYRNIYNNLLYIYKSKGTEKSFRNLVRCYGIDDSLVKINLYSSNLTYKLENTYEYTTEKKRYAEFYNSAYFNATVYQQTSSLISDSISYISASSTDLEKYTSFTLETDIILPKKRKETDRSYFSTPFITSSIFGFHTADPTTPTDFTWATTDYDLQVYAVRPPENNNTQDAYFMLTSSQFGVELRTNVFKDAYDNKKWNICVRLKPEKTHADLVSGSSVTNYSLEFYGVQSELDVVRSEFSLSSSLSGPEYLTEPKRIYAATHRQNFTGSAIHGTDLRLGTIRYWMSYLDNDVIQSHARDSFDFGVKNPYFGEYPFVTSLLQTQIPEIETLALNWTWDVVSSSNNSGQYLVYDVSSGSSNALDKYSWLSNVTQKQHTAIGDFYPAASTVVNEEYIPLARKKNPESLNPTFNSIKISSLEDEEAFTRNRRPVNYYYTLEKSMYETISEEMLRYFSTIVSFNNLIGEPANQYRSEYKDIEKLRALFFENIENDPNIEKYIEYYKWIDSSLSTMLTQLIPASSNFTDGIRTIIESHVLERNKYRNKLVTLGSINTDIGSGLHGIGIGTYDWAIGSPTLPSSPPPTNEHCFWWKNRTNRTNPQITSGDTAVDANRNAYLSASLSVLVRSYSTPLKFSMKKEEIYGTGLTSNNNNLTNYIKSSTEFGSSDGYLIEESKVKAFLDCNDVIDPQEKKKWSFEGKNQIKSGDYYTTEGDLTAPFVAVSSSVTTGYNSLVNSQFKSGFGIENLHLDTYTQGNVPLQGPFTEKYVGGNQYRHVSLNQGNDDQTNRPEGWNIQFQAAPTALKIIHQPINLPRATFYRDLIAKRPVNIRNIKDNAAKNEIGNYSKDYQIVQTCGRKINNVAFVKAGGFNIVYIPSPYVAGMDDYAKPQRGRTEHVFVNRFSSPGSPETAGDSNGGPGLDPTSAEYSPYNDLNYRNTSVRDPYRLLLSSHVNQFGFYSDEFGIGNGPSVVNSLNYIGTGSIYQVNRNPIKQIKGSGPTTITASVYDNYWIQHPIPRTDMQYAWITASATSYNTFGYLPYSGEVSSSSGPISLVTFSSASDYVSYFRDETGPNSFIFFGEDQLLLPIETVNFTSSYYIPTVYNGLNYNIYEPLNSTGFFIGHPANSTVDAYLNNTLIPGTIVGPPASGLRGNGQASLLNAILLKRNGPYQHPTWKQIRGNENPLVRHWNNTATTAYVLSGPSYVDPVGNRKIVKFGEQKILKDPPVVSKYNPIRMGFKVAVEVESDKYPPYVTLETVRLKNTYGNDFGQFANQEITNDLRKQNAADNLCDEDSSYKAILSLYINGALDQDESPITELLYLSYPEQVYPATINCYTKRNRERLGYQNTFWKDSRLERTTLGESKFGGDNSQGFPRVQSAWALDAAQQFGDVWTGGITGLASYPIWSYSVGASGELQNDYTFFWDAIFFVSSSLIRPSPILSRKQEIQSKYSVVTPTGMESLVLASTSPTYLSTYENAFSSAFPLGRIQGWGGNAKFEADKFAGYVEDGIFTSASATPFYDKYELYNLNMRLKNKDMSLIPEFRIGEHIQKYLTDSNGFVSENTASFSIFGVDSSLAPRNSSEDNFYRIYSFSDFMEYFEVFDEDHKEFDLPKTLTLSCKALMKFIPYDGFYPAERTLDIASSFSQSYSSYISCSGGTLTNGSLSDPLRMRPVYEPLFSPGILFNTIKSGVAVDYPVYSSPFRRITYQTGSDPLAPGASGYPQAIGERVSGEDGWSHRFNFEKLLNPEEINNIPLVDMNGSDKIRLDITSSLSDAPSGRNQYKMMINNFLGEVPSFFLNELTTQKSNKEEEFIFKPGTSYGMRVKMHRSMNQERTGSVSFGLGGGKFQVPQDVPTADPDLYETITMYSRPSAFGPPVAGTDRTLSGTINSDSMGGVNPSFTPPYYNGESWADILYNSGPSTGSVTLDEVLASASVKFLRIFPDTDAWPNPEFSSLTVGDYPMRAANADKYAMQLSASVNLFRKDSDNRWTIQTKFETPILNFGDKTKRPLGLEELALPSSGSGDGPAFLLGFGGQTSTPIGMWHQFGLIPEENQGIYLSIGDIPSAFLSYQELPPFYPTSLDSLADIVGFEKTGRKLGQLRDSKTVYEAIVAVPFIEQPDTNQEKTFFELPKIASFDPASKIEDRDPSVLFPSSTSQDILDMADKIKNKYVFPPQFDFIRNPMALPVAMYIFEFKHTFDKNDLSHIWQNLSPKFGTQYKEALSTISHPLLTGQMLKSMEGKVRWMVFKVKQRAKADYYSNIVGAPKTEEHLFGYNWPYDYFSMVEFAKIDAKVNFGKEPDIPIRTLSTASSGLLRTTFSSDVSQTSIRTTQDIRTSQVEATAVVDAAKEIKKREIK